LGLRHRGTRQSELPRVTRGRCWLEVDGDGTAQGLSTGDLVLLPHGPRHWLRDEPSSLVRWLDDILAVTPREESGRLLYGGNGDPTELVCGGFVLEGETVDPVLRALPEVVHVGGADGRPAPWVEATLELVAGVTGSDASGADAVLARLAETMVMQASTRSRRALDGRPARLRGWILALGVHRALSGGRRRASNCLSDSVTARGRGDAAGSDDAVDR
jgi:Cupin